MKVKVKVKIKLSMFTPCRHVGGAEVLLYPFLMSVLGGRLSWWCIVNVDTVLVCWHHLEVVCVADISEKHAASIFQ